MVVFEETRTSHKGPIYLGFQNNLAGQNMKCIAPCFPMSSTWSGHAVMVFCPLGHRPVSSYSERGDACRIMQGKNSLHMSVLIPLLCGHSRTLWLRFLTVQGRTDAIYSWITKQSRNVAESTLIQQLSLYSLSANAMSRAQIGCNHARIEHGKMERYRQAWSEVQ